MDCGKYRHEGQLMFKTKPSLLPAVMRRLELALKTEHAAWKTGFIEWLMQRESLPKSIMKSLEEDLVDWKSKGKDISRREFLENELDFGRRGN